MQQECNKVPQDASLDARCIERVTSNRPVHISHPGGAEKLKGRTDLKDVCTQGPWGRGPRLFRSPRLFRACRFSTLKKALDEAKSERVRKVNHLKKR